MDIRGYIKSNFKDDDINSIKESIVESIKSKDEVLLPGLGVFFELVWNNSSEDERINILKKIKKGI
ncbi:small acid-soluble spore protein I [Clostridium sp. CAG:1193]|nr:small acid-soluble spore protein I [Clostridium sp. CAG:1193]